MNQKTRRHYFIKANFFFQNLFIISFHFFFLRELAFQIKEQVDALAGSFNIKSCVICGGQGK